MACFSAQHGSVSRTSPHMPIYERTTQAFCFAFIQIRLSASNRNASEWFGSASPPHFAQPGQAGTALRSPKHSDNFSLPAEPVIIYWTPLSLLQSVLEGTLQGLLARKLVKGTSSVALFPHYTSKKCFNCDILSSLLSAHIYVSLSRPGVEAHYRG